MNGLKLIRTQCNISLNALADVLGVTRQMVSVWERGKKEIPEARLEQLSEYFGINAKFFGEVTDEQKKEVLGKPMYLWGDDENGYYLYRSDSRNRKIYFRNRERKCLPSEEFRQYKSTQRELTSKINHQITGPVQRHLGDQIASTIRGLNYYKYCYENMNLISTKPSIERMSYYYRLMEINKAITIAFGGECEMPDKKDDYCYDESPEFIRELAEYIKNYMNPKIDKIHKRKSN